MGARGTMWSSGGLMVIAGLCLVGGLAPAGQDATSVSIGTLRRVHSVVLKEDRFLSVRLPADYDGGRLSYPVIYLLYGDQTEGYYAETVFALNRLEGGAEIPEFILVGIHNTDRYGNLLPVRSAKGTSGADAFMDFLEKELFPFIEAEYRTKPYRLLIGPQAGGPFGLYALARRPALFNAFVLENPLQGSNDIRETVKASLRALAAARPEARASVFINSFNRTGIQDHTEATQALVGFLKEFEAVRPAGMQFWRRHQEEPTFVPSLELIPPLRKLFDGFYPSKESKLGNLADIQAYYRAMSQRVGFELEPPSFLLAVKSDDLSEARQTAAAREVLEYALRLRPSNTNALFRMGNLLLADGELNEAEKYFRQLQALRPDPFFAERLETIERIRRKSAAEAPSEVPGQRRWEVLPLDPNSDERWAPIEALKRQGPTLAEAFARHVHRNAKGEQMPYRLFTPARLDAGRTYPLVVFLHGSGGSGTDNVKQLQGANMFGALVWTLPEHQKRHPAFVLAPQSDVNWPCTIFDPKNPPKTLADIKFCPPGDLGIGARLAFEITDSLLATLPIDPARIYVTGHSMGGAGTWHMIAHRPRFFAAAVPVCGHPLLATAGTVKDVPIWNFHGVADDVEPVTTSRAMIEALRRAGGRPRHTEYEGVGHNVLMWAYTEPALVEWLFAQKR